MIEFQPIHNLAKLSSLLPQSVNFSYTTQELAHLTTMAISTRYDVGNTGELTKEDADKAYGLARNIYDDVKSEFSRQGISR